jgi:hypothetical protein
MKNIQLEIKGLSFVLRGNFNPVIFSPIWFAHEGLIRKEESKNVETQIIHPDVVSFKLDWMQLQVTRDMFSVQTMKEQYEEFLKDLVFGTFKLLRHTPLNSMGINRSEHFRIETVEKWHEIGHTLAPKKIWNDLLENPGLSSISITEGIRKDGLKGNIRVQVEPSAKVHPGIFILVNDHFEVSDSEETLGADEIINILENNWGKSLERSNNIITGLLEQLNGACTK